MVVLEFNKVLGPTGIYLPPHKHDDISVLAQKLHAINQSVDSGEESISMHTGFVFSDGMMEKILRSVETDMWPRERSLLWLWRGTETKVPDFDFDNDKEKVTEDREKYEKMALAMNRLWDVDCATAEHAVSLERNFPNLKLLVGICVKIDEEVETQLKERTYDEREIIMADLETYLKIIKLAQGALNRTAHCSHYAHHREVVWKAMEALKERHEQLATQELPI